MVGTTKKKYRILATWRFTNSTFDAVGVVVDFEVYFCISSFGQWFIGIRLPIGSASFV
jgi:hypothetical protein